MGEKIVWCKDADFGAEVKIGRRFFRRIRVCTAKSLLLFHEIAAFGEN